MMKRTTNFKPHAVVRKDRPEGTILLRSTDPLGPVADTTCDWLHHWAGIAPDRALSPNATARGGVRQVMAQR